MLRSFYLKFILYNYFLFELKPYFVSSATCLSNQITFNNKCYVFVNVGVTWSAAKTNCSDQGGYLINIDDEAEFNFTKSFFLNSGLPSLWLGLDATAPGEWFWTSGIPFPNTSSWWCTGEPNNSGGTISTLSEGCSDIWKIGCFNDIPCTTSSMPFICEFDEPTTTTITTTTTTPTTTKNLYCRNETTYFNNRCYGIYQENIDWYTADTNCKSKGGYLIIINDQAELDYLSSVLVPTSLPRIWIGLFATYPNTWWWLDNSTFSEYSTWWCETQPDNMGGTYTFAAEDCGEIISPDCLNDRPCIDILTGYICEFEIPTTTTTTTTITTTTIDPTTIDPTTITPTTIDPTTTTPTPITTTTITPTTIDPTTTTTTTITTTTIAPTTIAPTTITPTPITTTTITPITITTTTITPTTITTTTTLKPNLNCPNGTFGYNNCYSISQTTGDWNSANIDCAKQGGYLAIINDQTEFNYLQSYLNTPGLTRFWIGLNATKVNNWFWADSSTLAINSTWWYKSQPDNFGGNSTYLSEGCGEMWKSGINDQGCSFKNKYLCEFNPKTYTCLPYDQNSSANYCNLPSFFLLFALLILLLFLFHFLAFIFIVMFLAKYLKLKFSDKLRK